MSCYSPLRGYSAKDGRWVWKKPTDTAPKKMNVKCGQCLGCRLDNAAQWAARITHEATLWEHNCFITLTYRDKSQCDEDQLQQGLHVPEDMSLNKKHLQKFIKRLRHNFPGTRIRYYACGEYGDQNNRPHYHLCAFNLQFSDEELYSNNGDHPLFTSETLEQIWGYGFATIGELTYESAAYTARYVLKKITGARGQDHYLRCDEYGVAYWLEPEFTTMSRRPGIATGWIEKYQDDVYPSDEVPVPGKGNVKGTPRFYDDALKKVDPDLYENIKEARAKYARENPLEFSPQRLEAKYRCKKALNDQLKRGL